MLDVTSDVQGRSELTTTVYIVLRLRDLLPIHDSSSTRFLAHVAPTFTQNHDLVSGDIILLNRLADNLLAHAIAIYIRRVPSVQSTIIRCFEERKGFLLVDDPGLPGRVAKGHGAEDGHGDAQAAVAQALVAGLRLCDGAQDGVLFGGRHCWGFVGWFIGTLEVAIGGMRAGKR